ncbi:hypothetical protein BO71DRAFT_398936, partial [Aspergillus ellipticus CBS 707.79]
MYFPTLLNESDAERNLARLRCALWEMGISIQFWHFHPSLAAMFKKIILPSPDPTANENEDYMAHDPEKV